MLHPNPIAWHFPVTGSDEVDIEYGRAYEVGFTWGGPDNDFELWIDGELVGSFDLPAGVALPWGVGGSATNLGLGANHERGYGTSGNYASVAGLTYSNLRIWDEYRSFGDTSPPPELPQLNIKRTEVGVELSWARLRIICLFCPSLCGYEILGEGQRRAGRRLRRTARVR